ncbi:MAG: chalcone isomerase family protein [Flavobacteriales bacterium]
MKKVLLLLFVALSAQIMAQSKTISGVKFPLTEKIGKQELVLNGGGLREKYWMDLYVAALYVETKTTDASKVIFGNEEMAIQLKIISSSVTRERFIESVNEGFANASCKASADEKKKFIAFFSEEFKNGDIIHFDYTPEKGVKVTKNGVVKGTIPGYDFKKALFSIWLGSKPADENLKKGMLGKG